MAVELLMYRLGLIRQGQTGANMAEELVVVEQGMQWMGRMAEQEELE